MTQVSEQIRSIVLQTRSARHFHHRVDQLMFLEAKLKGLHLGSRVEVTGNVSCLISLLLQAAADLIAKVVQ